MAMLPAAALVAASITLPSAARSTSPIVSSAIAPRCLVPLFLTNLQTRSILPAAQSEITRQAVLVAAFAITSAGQSILPAAPLTTIPLPVVALFSIIAIVLQSSTLPTAHSVVTQRQAMV